jgi:hypothetical protein
MKSSLALCALFASSSAGEAYFTKKPTARRVGDKVKIDFAVSRETDVSVLIEDGNGKVIRHLIAGVLGRNPSPPLKANVLDQSVEWDGKADFNYACADEVAGSK